MSIVAVTVVLMEVVVTVFKVELVGLEVTVVGGKVSKVSLVVVISPVTVVVEVDSHFITGQH